MKLKTYQKMKNLESEWIKQIPQHWDLIPLKHLLEIPISDGPHTTPVFLNTGIPFVSAESVKNGKIDFDYAHFISKENHEEYSKKCKPQRNDILLVKAGNTTGKIALVDVDFEFSVWSPLALIRLNKNNFSKYIFYFMNSNIFQDQINLTVNWNTQPNIGMRDIENLFIVKPLLEEQKQISNFLDKEIGKICSNIQKNQKLIKLLNEKRQAIIDQAVTKGLDPAVLMKDSCISGVGKIPKHWKIYPLKYVLQKGKIGIKIGPFGSSLKLDIMKELGFKVYGQENVIRDDFTIGHRFIDEEKFKEMQGYEIQPGDIVITMMGTTGHSKVVPDVIEKGIMDSHLVRIKIDSKICISNYLSHIIDYANYIKSQMKMASNGAIMEGLNSSIIKSLIICIPESTKEQKQIVDFLDKETEKIDAVIEKTETQIEKLQEYRQSLISSVVTGKIDVREEVIAQ